MPRIVDILVSAMALAVFLPLVAVCVIAVRLSSPGPILFRQTRLGLRGRTFQLLKFRSMYVNAPDLRNPDGSSVCQDHDPRVTPVGRLLRETSLDELPQLINVLFGDMALVGPRPDQADQLRFYSQQERRKLLVRPGITGLAQISGRNEITWEQRKALDVEYVARRSFGLEGMTIGCQCAFIPAEFLEVVPEVVPGFDRCWNLLAGAVLRVRRLDNPNWTRLPGTEGYYLPTFWAEDSSSIGFVTAGRLRVIPLDGSVAKDLMAAPGFQGASWRGGRSDGTILLATDGKLKTFDLRSATIRDLPLEFKTGERPRSPVFLPQGDGFVFLQDRGEGTRLFRSALKSSSIEPYVLTETRVSFAKHPSTGKWHIFYVSGERDLRTSRILLTAPVDAQTGKLLSDPVKLLQGLSRGPFGYRFSIGDGGVLTWAYADGTLPVWRLTWTDRNGAVLARIAENRAIVSIALSPDESKIAAQVEDPDPHIWILDAKTGLGGRISSGPGLETSPLWAPDGKAVFYCSSSADTWEIKRRFLDNTTSPESLYHSSKVDRIGFTPAYLSGVSPDGRYLLVQADHTQGFSLGRLDLLAEAPRKLEPISEGIPLVAQPAIRAQQGALGYAVLSPDGQSLAWDQLMLGVAVQAFPPASQTIKRFKRGGDRFAYPLFSPDGRTLYAASNGNLLAFPLSPDRSIGEPKVLFRLQLPDRPAAKPFAVSRDGNRILVIDTDERERLTPQILTDWTTLLGK
jgi:lipopolysaccharide/colanic/teichoic acid biosynthesis glycosyltransferase/WD40 repeat protein